MTGFARGERHEEGFFLSLELRSVNSRYLDIVVNVPSALSPLEAEIRKRISGRLGRGKVECTVRLRDYDQEVTVTVDPSAVTAALSALRQVGEIAGTSENPALETLLRIDGLIRVERSTDADRYREPLVSLMDEVLETLDEARRADGIATKDDLLLQLGRIRTMAEVFEENGPETERMIFESVRSRFRDVLGDEAEENRIYAEAASLIVKHSINEEVVRLRSHLDLFGDTMALAGTVGKKLDFIAQEINREINTMASKSMRSELQSAVVEAKDALESIREHVRNIE